MKFLTAIIICAAISIGIASSIPAHELYAQMPHALLTILASIFTSVTLITLIIWLIVHRIMNARLNKLLAITRHHLPPYEAVDRCQHQLIAVRLKKLIDSFIRMSAEIEEHEIALIRSNEFTSTILNNISDAVTVIDPKTYNILAVNRAFLNLYNIKLGNVIGKKCCTVANCSPFDRDETGPCPGQRAIETGKFCQANRIVTLNNIQRILDVNTTPIVNNACEVIQLIRVAHDITAPIRHQQQIQHMAYHDSLTGLPNRELFKDRLNQALLYCERNNTSGVIALLDLDRFKQINDTFGHAGGDTLLKVVAQRLTDAVRDSDTVARMSGDEFLIIYHQVNNEEHAQILAKQLIATLNQPITLSGNNVTIAASIGMCFFPKSGSSVDELLKCTDDAMYVAKNGGRNNYHLSS